MAVVKQKPVSLFGTPLPLLKGLAFTLKTFFTKPITYQYPDQKREPSERWRGLHRLKRDDKGRVKVLYHFARLQMPAVKLPEPAFLAHLETSELRCEKRRRELQQARKQEFFGSCFA